ncbi:ATP-binding protein [Streptomyces sp. NPDC058914]|uniref:ATP-binding protein n=1 Tax=Streptomyces TaxID=1883 RepID=UPI00369C0384
MATTTPAAVSHAARGVGPRERAWLAGQEMALTLDAAPVSASRARHASRDALAGWGVQGDTVHDVLLMMDELFTNAVEHGRGPVSLRLRLHRGNTVVCEVSDVGGELPHRRDRGPAAESGRGLLLVHALADATGVRPTSTGKVVWFRRRVPPPA